jgi:hypothetical protein
MKKTLISLTATAILAIGLSATAAKADGLGLDFGFDSAGHSHFGVSVSDGYDSGYYDAGYADESACGYEMVKGWYWKHHHKAYGWHKAWICGDY